MNSIFANHFMLSIIYDYVLWFNVIIEMWSSLSSKLMVNQFPARQYPIQSGTRKKIHEYSDLINLWISRAFLLNWILQSVCDHSIFHFIPISLFLYRKTSGIVKLVLPSWTDTGGLVCRKPSSKKWLLINFVQVLM